MTSDPSGKLSNWVSGAVPIEIAGRYRFTPKFSAGIYFQYDPAFVAAFSCLESFSCSASNVRVGAEAVYAFLPDSTFNPWVSVGTGWGGQPARSPRRRPAPHADSRATEGWRSGSTSRPVPTGT